MMEMSINDVEKILKVFTAQNLSKASLTFGLLFIFLTSASEYMQSREKNNPMILFNNSNTNTCFFFLWDGRRHKINASLLLCGNKFSEFCECRREWT